MKSKLKRVLDNNIPSLMEEDDVDLRSELLDLINVELTRYKKEVELLREEIEKLTIEKYGLEKKFIFLNKELKVKFNKKDSKTIAYLLGDTIIRSVKNPKKGFLELPSNASYLFKETIKRRGKKKTASRVDKILSILLEDPSINKNGNNKKNIAISNNAKIVKEKVVSKKDTYAMSDKKTINKFLSNKVNRTSHKVLTAVSNELNQQMSNKFVCYALETQSIDQIKSLQPNIFFLESGYDFDKNIWAYGLQSNNPDYPLTKKIINEIREARRQGVKIVFLDKSSKYNSNDFDLIRNQCDEVVFLSSFLKDSLSLNSKKTLVDNFFDEMIFYPELGDSSKKGVCFLASYESIHLTDVDYLYPFIQIVNANAATVIKSRFLESKVFNGFEDSRLINYSNNHELALAIRSHDILVFITNPEQDFIPKHILIALACGVPVITNEAVYIENNESIKGFLTIINSNKDVDKAIKSIKANNFMSKQKIHLGYRFVMNYFRSEFLSSNIFRSFEVDDKGNFNKKELVTIIMATKRDYFCSRVIENLTVQNYSNKEVVILTQNWSAQNIKRLKQELNEKGGFSSIKVLIDNTDTTLGERLNICAKYASEESKYIAKMDDDDFYFENYLSDMLLPFKFGDFDMVGKGENFVYLEAADKLVRIRDDRGAYRGSEFIVGPTIFIRKDVFIALNGFKHVNTGEDSDLIKRVILNGSAVYSADPFNFIQFRSKNVASHTWQVSHEVFESSCKLVSKGLNVDYVKI